MDNRMLRGPKARSRRFYTNVIEKEVREEKGIKWDFVTKCL